MIREHCRSTASASGTFHALSVRFRQSCAGYFIEPDNAQMWFRHILAEFGLIGSIPMLCGGASCWQWLMFSRPAGDRLSFGMLRRRR